jgi:hypothetical protein
MRFVSFAEVADRLRDRTVAIVGSGPSCIANKPGYIDSHDVVVRCNNYKTGTGQGRRCDVFYSFFGSSIRKRATDLQADGCKLLLCKCPDSKPIESEWHERNGKQAGIDFRYIYKARAKWWFTDTYIPDDGEFLRKLAALDGHIPTTGFAAILDVLRCDPASVMLTGFDFFKSGLHNVNERWRPGDPNDPIGHAPELELAWIARNRERYPMTFDRALEAQLASQLNMVML